MLQRESGEKKEKERKLDLEFANRLKSIDLEDEGIDNELPKAKK